MGCDDAVTFAVTVECAFRDITVIAGTEHELEPES